MDVADMDGDGDGDVIGVLNNGLQLWLNNGHGRFTRGDTIGNSPVNGFRLGDLDCDSDKDIYIAIDGVDELWLNNGSAQFTRRMQAFSASNTSGVQLGDVDGDADLDAVVTHTTQSQLWLNDGSGIFMLIPQFDITTSAEHRLHLIDLNNDGRSDIVTEILYPFGTEFFNVLSARLSIGDGVFVGIPDFNHLIRSGSVSRNNIKIADLNGDQFNDMLVTYTETSQILLNSVNNNYGAILADPNIGIMSVQVRDRFVQVLESDNEANISITPVVVSSAGLSVNYSTQDYTALAGEDYVETSGTLSWSPGDNSEKTVSVDLLPDQVAESGEALLLRLEFSSNQNLSKVITTPIVILYDEFPHSVANQCAVNLPIGDDTGGSGGGLFGRFILLLLFFVAMVRLYKPRLSFP
jgi:hypothetical protein